MGNDLDHQQRRCPGQSQRRMGTSVAPTTMIIFLDIDGVLHPKYIGAKYFCRTELLWKILRAAPHVQVVFSSSWRVIYRYDELVEFVTCDGGEDLAHRFIGQTPSIKVKSDCDARDLEIQNWLDTSKHTGHWLALDDMPELFHGGHPNLYLVNGATGLSEADVAAIIQRIKSASVFGSEWGQQVLRNVQRMTVDEEYRKSIAHLTTQKESKMEALNNLVAYPPEVAVKIEQLSTIAVSIANRWMLGWPERVAALLAAATYLEALEAQTEQEKDMLAEAGELNHLARHEILKMYEIQESPPQANILPAS